MTVYFIVIKCSETCEYLLVLFFVFAYETQSTGATFNKRANDDFRQFCHDNSPFWQAYHLDVSALNVFHILSLARSCHRIRPLCLRIYREEQPDSWSTESVYHTKMTKKTRHVIPKFS